MSTKPLSKMTKSELVAENKLLRRELDLLNKFLDYRDKQIRQLKQDERDGTLQTQLEESDATVKAMEIFGKRTERAKRKADYFRKESTKLIDGKKDKANAVTEAMFEYYSQSRIDGNGIEESRIVAASLAKRTNKTNTFLTQQTVHRRFLKRYGKNYDSLINK